MKKLSLLFFTVFTSLTLLSQKPATKENTGGKVYGPVSANKNVVTRPRTPDEIWGKLFVDVQLKRILGDNKTFVDVIPKFEPGIILKRYNELVARQGEQADLKAFVEQNFKIPVAYTPKLPTSTKTLKEHLERLWPILTRKADIREKNSSLLPLPYPYVVPGGRFREIYYWDSYFTMQGLAVSNRFDLIENMLDNFKYLIDTYGHIPNGNRSYYLSRSQPPYFALMVDLLAEKKGSRIYKKYLSAMLKEYGWWMEGEQDIKEGSQHRRIVKLADGTVMNRYWDDKPAPREESYYQDVQTGLTYRSADKLAYTHLRAGAESGWDFSSRWFADTMDLSSIETANIIPVDLNCLLYKYEIIITKALTSQKLNSKATAYTIRANARKAAILQYCWNGNEHFFFDYHINKQATTNK
jgi:alpha,alpha-trehalase